MTAAVLARELAFAFRGGEFTLAVPRLELAPGEVVGITGPSGSGKTTLLDLLAGIRVPARGLVACGGFEWARHTERERRAHRRAHVGLVFQEFELLEYLSALENVLLATHLDRAVRRDPALPGRARELLDAAGLSALAHRRPARLSQGERQRVAVCRALLPRPDLVLADEPTGNLDARSADRVLDLLVGEARARGTTLVVVTHDARLRPRFDRVLAMEELCA